MSKKIINDHINKHIDVFKKLKTHTDLIYLIGNEIRNILESKGFKFNVIDFQNGDEAGLKDCTIEIVGDYAYGLMQSEIGIHRLVRISPFDSNSRRHTSFASVSVSPSINDDIDIEINQNKILIKMTLTNPNCPVAGKMPENVGKSIEQIEGLKSIEVKLVWQPPWNKDLMSEDAKLALDIF